MKRGLLLSGGTDSIALAHWKRPQYAYTVNYGQAPFDGELRAAATICEILAIPHRVVSVDCRSLGSGDMAGAKPSIHAPVPEWWPYRNQLLVTLAAMRALDDGVQELMLGSVKSDGIHADGRAEFYRVLNDLVKMQEGGISISVPAIEMTTVELIRVSQVPIEILSWSHSCHISDFACGQCRGCVKHSETMRELGYGDY